MANLTDKQLQEKALGPYGVKFVEGPFTTSRAWFRNWLIPHRREQRRKDRAQAKRDWNKKRIEMGGAKHG